MEHITTVIDNEEQGAAMADQLVIDGSIKAFLLETAKWARFLAILGFIGMGLFLLAGLYGNFSGTVNRGLDSLTAFAYIAMAVLYYFPIMYLFRFAVNTKKALEANVQEDIQVAFMNLKSHYKFVGIATIVVLSIYVVLLVFLFGKMM